MDCKSEKVSLKYYGFMELGLLLGLAAILTVLLLIWYGRPPVQAVWEQSAGEFHTQESESSSSVYEFREHAISQMASGLVSGSGQEFAQQLWDNQTAHNIYKWEEIPQLFADRKTYYISSSEGSDNNSGLSPDKPKKTLAQYSGVSNVNVLLKCGDVFDLNHTFVMGSNMIVASYGSGPRPLLNYYQQLRVTWTRADGYRNVWKAGLSAVADLNNGKANSSNYNIGHLKIDGIHNWKRTADGIDYPGYLQNAADESWGIDWESGQIYLYDTQDPNTRSIEYAMVGTAVSMNNTENTRLMGLEITGAGFHGILMSGVSDAEVKSCYIHHIGGGYLNYRTTRYGNAVELWNSGVNVEVAHNMAEWIYDTCYTNQSQGADIIQKNIRFYRNIARFSFWGMESWGNPESGHQFDNITYEENILMYACDITAPKTKIYATVAGVNVDGNGNRYMVTPSYTSYRTGYFFHQMALISTSSASAKNILTCRNNICWESNRFLCITSVSEHAAAYSGFSGNIFYAEIPAEEIAVFRTEDPAGRHYKSEFPFEGNTAYLIRNGQDKVRQKAQALNYLNEALSRIANGGQR